MYLYSIIESVLKKMKLKASSRKHIGFTLVILKFGSSFPKLFQMLTGDNKTVLFSEPTRHTHITLPKRKKDKVTKNANDVSVTFFALLEILMKSVLPHHAHINKKMNDNNNNILLRSRSAAEEKKAVH